MMTDKNEIIIPLEVIMSKIYLVCGVKVMLDKDLAELYGVETRVLNQAVRRNKRRFPDDFMFQMSKDEMENWKSQIVISNSEKMGLRKPPLAFTEQGVAMLSSVLNRINKFFTSSNTSTSLNKPGSNMMIGQTGKRSVSGKRTRFAFRSFIHIHNGWIIPTRGRSFQSTTQNQCK